MFQPVATQVDFPLQEREVLAFWARTQAFDRLRKLRAASDKRFSFIDGPITANNPMGVHHAWGRTYKDLWQRYFAMQGYNQRWQNGFDCQGLWVEVNVEKDMGFKSKRDIEAFGMERFIRLCKQRVLNSAAMQTEQSIRLGYWMDWNDPDELRWLAQKIVEDPQQVITLERGGQKITGTVEQIVGRLGLPELGGSYFTFSDENNYQIWNFLKKCHEKGWIYRGEDVIPWCPRCATGISQHEIDTEGYKDREDPAITVRMKLKSFDVSRAAWVNEQARAKFDHAPGKFLLAWTTTPWTLPANIMASVGPKLTYAIVRQLHKDGELAVYFLSNKTLKILRGEYEVLGEILGEHMAGWTYEGLFDDLPAFIDAHKRWQDKHDGRPFEHIVITWDGVGEDEGTGIVHNAPGAGPEDYQLGQQHGMPKIAPLNEDGYFLDGFGELTGKHAHEVADLVEALLKAKGYFYRHDKYLHRYAHCWRCGTPLVYRMVDEWYISMDELRYDMMAVSEQINWIPPFGKERELDWLRNMHDWMISKKRYWGLALPIWEYPDGTFEVIGSYEELKARAVEGWEEFDGHTPHRPHIDKVKIKHPVTGLIGTRVPDVGNPWLDAGIVAYSTLRYRTDRAYWQQWFPADFITESFPGQFRNWFYSLIAMSTVLEKHLPARTILGYATLLDEKGEPMHKSKGNAIEFNEAADKAGADVMRWLYARQRYDDNLLFGYNALNEVRRQVIIPLWNVYAFFVTYANADRWTPTAEADTGHGEPASLSLLDKWILARLAETTNAVNAALDAYDARPAVLAIEKFIDDLSNWYVRRSRERFWGSQMTSDKAAAYATLYEVLTALARLIAPIVPFISEVMWQNLKHPEFNLRSAEDNRRLCESQQAFSVHHQSYPQPRALSEEERALLREVALARTVVALGHSTRAQSKLKVRQPLRKAMIVANDEARRAIMAHYEVITDELNVKALEFVEREVELVSYRVLPDLKKLGKKLGADLPKVRAALGQLDPSDVAAAVKAGQPIAVNGVSLQPDEVIVQAVPREGLIVAGENGIVVGLDTTLDDALIAEGLAREVVRRVNDLRKAAGLNVSDRIRLAYTASDRLRRAIGDFAEYIKGETLSVALIEGRLPDAISASDAFDGEQLTLSLEKASD
ncbi:MAG: class I tRNA ligase family protein [Thermoflexales bacterium]|nr:class I tRNA ligase family protein [Thermoflexales bacterium]